MSKRRVKYIKPSTLCTWLTVAFYLVNLFRMTARSTSLYLIVLYVAGLIGLMRFLIDKKLHKIYVIAFIYFYLTSLLINSLIIGNVGFRDIMNEMLLIGIMVAMIAFPLSYLKGRVVFYVTAVVFTVAYLAGINSTELLSSSGNYISIILLLALSLYYIGLQNENRAVKIVDLIPIVICFLFSIWAKGRGGILSCGLTLVLLLYLYAYEYADKSKKRYYILMGVVVIAVMWVLIRDVSIIDRFFDLGKWGTRGMDNTARELIWGTYFLKVKESPIYLFFGAPLNNISLIHAFNNNTHNSFIQLHANTGLVVSVLFVILMIKSIIYQLRFKKYILVIMQTSLIIRGMTDKFIFGQYGMPIILFLTFYPFFDNYISVRMKQLYR